MTILKVHWELVKVLPPEYRKDCSSWTCWENVGNTLPKGVLLRTS